MKELVDYVCSRRPLLCRLVGRSRVEAVVADVVAAWPDATLATIAGHDELERQTLEDLRQHVVREKRYSNPILVLWGIGIVINLIWQWWLSRRDNREKLLSWQRATEAGS